MLSRVEAALTEVDKLPRQHHFMERETDRMRDTARKRDGGEKGWNRNGARWQFRLHYKGLFNVESLIRLMEHRHKAFKSISTELLDADLQN